MKWSVANSSRAISPEDRRRQLEAAIFLIPFVTYAYFYQGADQSIACRFDLIRSMVEKGVLWINDFCGYNTADIITFHGHIYSVKAPGTSYTALIPWMIFRIALLPMNAVHEPVYWALVTYLTTVFTTGLLIALMCVIMFRFARFLGASDGRAAGVALILGLSTIAFPYATELTGEPVAAVCVFTAFYLLATFETRPSSMRACAAGFLAGWAVLNDYPVFLVAAAIGIYALFKLRDLKFLAAFSAGAAITVVVMLAYNWGAFGNPFFFSYQAFKLAPTENRQFPEQAVGFVGLTYPKMRILWNVLLDPQRGLFFCNPVLLLSIVGVGYFARTKKWRAEFFVTVYSFVVLILFNAAYGESIVSWGGGTATGPRQIVASVPFMVLALAFLLCHQPRRILRRRHDRTRLCSFQPRQAGRTARPASAVAAGGVLDLRLVRFVGNAWPVGHRRLAPLDAIRDDCRNRGAVPALDESASPARLRAERASGTARQVLRRRPMRRDGAAYRARRSATGLQRYFRDGRDAFSVLRHLARPVDSAKDRRLRIHDRR
jgi:hypothetical protein